MLCLCANHGYLRNMHKLHKKDIPSDSNPFKLCLMLMLAGDIELNPGPIDWSAKCKYAEYFQCGICECEVDWGKRTGQT